MLLSKAKQITSTLNPLFLLLKDFALTTVPISSTNLSLFTRSLLLACKYAQLLPQFSGPLFLWLSFQTFNHKTFKHYKMDLLPPKLNLNILCYLFKVFLYFILFFIFFQRAVVYTFLLRDNHFDFLVHHYIIHLLIHVSKITYVLFCSSWFQMLYINTVHMQLVPIIQHYF